MQPHHGFPSLVFGQRQPVVLPRPVFPSRHPAGPGRPAVENGPVQVHVDDLVVGHGVVPLVFNTPNLSQRTRHVAFDRHPILNETLA